MNTEVADVVQSLGTSRNTPRLLYVYRRSGYRLLIEDAFYRMRSMRELTGDIPPELGDFPSLTGMYVFDGLECIMTH